MNIIRIHPDVVERICVYLIKAVEERIIEVYNS